VRACARARVCVCVCDCDISNYYVRNCDMDKKYIICNEILTENPKKYKMGIK